MFDHLNVDLATNCIKNIVDNSRCVTCDKLNGPFLRYICGHSICMNCKVSSEECQFCVTPHVSNTTVDSPETQRVHNAVSLLNAFHDVFKIDVYKRHRKSKQLKIEKQLFPECIQAPLKYCNKRTSSNNSFYNKENIPLSPFLGENIPHKTILKMDKSINYVQQWLNQQDNSSHKLSRRPFTDLNVNAQKLGRNERKSITALDKIRRNFRSTTKKKKAHIKNNLKKPLKKYLEVSNSKTYSNLKGSNGTQEDSTFFCEKSESGIVIDDDLIVINDTQSETVDKDKLALMAVMQAGEYHSFTTKHHESSNSAVDKSVDSLYEKSKIDYVNVSEQSIKLTDKKVPFYKRGVMYETCKMCNNLIVDNMNEDSTNTKNVMITIENEIFITTIKFSNLEHQSILKLNKCSVGTQTENSLKNCSELDKPSKVNGSQDIFFDDMKINYEKHMLMERDEYLKDTRCLVISDSDSDININDENYSLLEVTAEIHRSSDQIEGVLSEVGPSDHGNLTRRKRLRSSTPRSSDSSDKENVDPNRCKRSKVAKKPPKK